MTTIPRISVVMSTAGEPLEFVKAAVESVMSQSLRPIEYIIVIDDGGNGPVVDYLVGVANVHEQVRLLRHETTQGLAVCRNEGITAAVGEYVALMDADDISLPDRLERQYAYLIEHAADGVFSGVQYIDAKGAGLGIFIPTSRRPARDIFVRHIFVHPTGFFTRAILLQYPYDSQFLRAQDVDLWIRLLRQQATLAIVPMVLLQYRLHRQQSVPDRLNRQRLYARYGCKIVQKHWNSSFTQPVFWWFTIKWTSWYLFYQLLPAWLLQGIIKVKDWWRGRRFLTKPML